MELSAYKTLLNKLVPLSYQYDLDGLLDNTLPEADEDTRFQLQAEVRRLTAPCLRVLDLRSLFPEQCQLFSHQGLDHQLPEHLASRFETLLADYAGEYTRGLYESLLADLAALRKLPAQFNTLPWHLPSLGQQRKESRLRFVTPVYVHIDGTHTDDIQIAAAQVLQANTLDISAAGLLVQLQEPLRLPSEVAISFPDLAKQLGLECLAQPKRYRLVQDENELARLKLQRIEADADWQLALTTFIEQNRPRYGLDAQDLYATVKSQCWGQALLETSASWSLFFDNQGELQHLLTNRHSAKMLAAWQQDKPGDLLSTLLSPARILALTKESGLPCLLYSFRFTNGKQSYYFVANQDELIAQQAYGAFINEGLNTNTLSCYYLNIRALRYEDQDTAALDIQGASQLQQLKWQLWITPIPAPRSPWPIESTLKQIAQFRVLPRLNDAIVTPLGRQASKRKEARFKLKSAIELTLGNKVLKGHTEDLSNRGIKLVLNEAVRLAVPCLGYVHMTELSKRSRQWALKKLPYRVVNVSGNGKVLHLLMEGSEENHAGFQFFSALLEQNQDKLRAKPETHHTPTWLIWLTRQTLQQPPAPTFLLGRNDGGFYVQGAIACVLQQSLMGFLSNEFQQAHFSRLISRQQWQTLYSQLLRPDGRSHHSYEIWTAKAADGSKNSWLLLDPDPTRQAFLLDARHSQQLRVSLVIVNRLQLRQLAYFVPEWETLTQTSLHKTQQLEQQLAELCALSQVFDITEAVLRQAAVKPPVLCPVPLPN